MTRYIHKALDRGVKEKVFNPETRAVEQSGFLKVLKHLPHVCYVKPEEMARGIPTALSGPPLSEEYNFKNQDVYV